MVLDAPVLFGESSRQFWTFDRNPHPGPGLVVVPPGTATLPAGDAARATRPSHEGQQKALIDALR